MVSFQKSTATVAAWNLAGLHGIETGRLEVQADELALIDGAKESRELNARLPAFRAAEMLENHDTFHRLACVTQSGVIDHDSGECRSRVLVGRE